MEFEDEFFQIGAEFTEPPVKDKRFDYIDSLSEQTDKLTEARTEAKTKMKHTVIRIEPSDKYPVPDTTGNGVLALEGYEDRTLDAMFSEEDKKLVKLNYELYKKSMVMIKETDKTVASTISKHRLPVHKRKFIDVLFTKAMQCSYSYVNCKYTYKKQKHFERLVGMFTGLRKTLDALDFSKEFTYMKALRCIGDDYLEEICRGFDNTRSVRSLMADDKHDDVYNFLNDIVSAEMANKQSVMETIIGNLVAVKNKWVEEKKFIGEIIDDTSYIDDFMDFQKSMVDSWNKYKVGTFASMGRSIKNRTDQENPSKLFVVLEFLYCYSLALCGVVTDMNTDFQRIMILLEPTSSNMKTTRLIDTVEAEDAWISSDYHLLSELLKGSGKNISRTDRIIAMHNKYVKPQDLFLFLGDLSEQEFYDQNMKAQLNMLFSVVKALNGRKIMITGNNDTGSDDLYKKMGFLEVVREPVLLGRHVFSHEPIKTEEGILNIHGHIHGSKSYFGVDYENHIDAFYGLYGHPVRLSFLDSFYEEGKYTGCKTVFEEKY